MPYYNYACPEGHEKEYQHKISGEGKPEKCEVCQKPLERKISLVASVFPGAANWRKR